MRGPAVFLLAVAFACAQAPGELFDRAVAALSAGDYAAAEAGFQQVLQRSPNHVDSLLNLGIVFSRTGRADQAIAAYRRVLELSPASESARLNLGLAYMRKQSYGDALGVFQELIERNPGSLPARDIHLLFPLCDHYLRQDRSEEGRRRLDAFLAVLPAAAANLVKCKIFYGADRFEEARAACRRALDADPRFPGAHLELARVLVAQQSPDASGELAAAIRENPGDPEAMYDLGVALFREGRAEEASTYLERARRADPGFWGSYFELGRIRLQANQPEQALPLLRKAAELNPSSFSLFYILARALTDTGHPDEAAHAFARVRELMAEENEQDARVMRKK